MTIYAYTDITAQDKAGKPVKFKCGEEVTGLSADLMKDLKESGALSKVDRTAAAVAPMADDERAALQEENEGLQARIAELEADKKPQVKPQVKPQAKPAAK